MTYAGRPPGIERIGHINAFRRHKNKHSRRFKAQPNILLLLHEKNVGDFAFVVAPTQGHEPK